MGFTRGAIFTFIMTYRLLDVTAVIVLIYCVALDVVDIDHSTHRTHYRLHVLDALLEHDNRVL